MGTARGQAGLHRELRGGKSTAGSLSLNSGVAASSADSGVLEPMAHRPDKRRPRRPGDRLLPAGWIGKQVADGCRSLLSFFGFSDASCSPSHTPAARATTRSGSGSVEQNADHSPNALRVGLVHCFEDRLAQPLPDAGREQQVFDESPRFRPEQQRQAADGMPPGPPISWRWRRSLAGSTAPCPPSLRRVDDREQVSPGSRPPAQVKPPTPPASRRQGIVGQLIDAIEHAFPGRTAAWRGRPRGSPVAERSAVVTAV